jgi:TetR/AcrR family transcriptional regulator, regulator of cefoperazone and chloramphenicol sensitivity
MRATAKKRSPTPARRAPRPDGDATRLLLIETAGQVFAERGYAEATSKEICERAGTPLASVNYHFGNRDGLYEAVLIAAHQQVVGLEDLVAVADDIDDPVLRLRTVLKHLVRLATRAAAPWGFRVVLREVMTPSAAMPALIEKAIRPKAQFMLGLVSRAMGLPPEHPTVQRGLIFALLPCLAIMVVPKEVPAKLLPAIARESDGLAEELMCYVMAGLDAMARAQQTGKTTQEKAEKNPGRQQRPPARAAKREKA